ncbi:MAG: hypothetical protein WAU88_03145 [Candidatus Zixiibacteriota bacterium]
MNSSGPHSIFRILNLAAISFGYFLVLTGHTNAQVAIPWSTLSNSPRSVAMGSCGVNIISPETPIYSPGALGIYALDHVLAGALPNNTDFHHELGTVPNDVNFAGNTYLRRRYQTWGAIAAPTYKLGKPDSTTQFRLSVGLAYSHIRWDWGTQVDNTLKVYDQVNCVSGAVGVEFRKFIRFGVGYTYRRISSHLPFATRSIMDGELLQITSASKVHDYGLVGQLNLHSLLPHKFYLGQSRKYFLHVEVTPSYGYVKSNVGDAMVYSDSASYDQFVSVVSEGPAIGAALKINEAALLSFFWCSETQKRGHRETRPHGIELGIGGILFLRQGDDVSKVDIGYKGTGFGLSLRGVTAWLNTFGVFNRIHGSIGEFVRRLDVSFDYARRKHVDDVTAGPYLVPDIKYYKVTISFAN